VLCMFVFEELDLYLPEGYKCEKQSCADNAYCRLVYSAELCVDTLTPSTFRHGPDVPISSHLKLAGGTSPVRYGNRTTQRYVMFTPLPTSILSSSALRLLDQSARP
jgi:hypothetical protein